MSPVKKEGGIAHDWSPLDRAEVVVRACPSLESLAVSRHSNESPVCFLGASPNPGNGNNTLAGRANSIRGLALIAAI